jgi:hypothetical protein
VEDHCLERTGSVMWQADTSKVVASHLYWLRTDGLTPRASIEQTDHILVI